MWAAIMDLGLSDSLHFLAARITVLSNHFLDRLTGKRIDKLNTTAGLESVPGADLVRTVQLLGGLRNPLI